MICESRISIHLMWCLAVAALVLATAGCSSPGGQECDSDADCPRAYACVSSGGLVFGERICLLTSAPTDASDADIEPDGDAAGDADVASADAEGADADAAGTDAAATDADAAGADADTSGGDCLDGQSRDCGTSTGACELGTQTCQDGAWGECQGAVGPREEVCDGLDNDCNGLVDDDAEGMVLMQRCGNRGCPGSGVQHCLDGQWTQCEEDRYEICDGEDANCDSVADNPSPCYQACPGGHVATGTLVCARGGSVCELPQEICGDGIDNNCDGVVDGGCDANGLDEMIFVPGGPFWMGSRQSDWQMQQDEAPQHLVELDPYYVDRLEVSRAEYMACVDAGECTLPGMGRNICPDQGTGSTPDWEDKPIGCVSREQAADYCVWAGKRLPTAAEWEKAARGPYPRQVLFPWGDAINPGNAVAGCDEDLNQCTVVVDSYPQGASFYGALHMAGNIDEWVSDYYDAEFYSSGYRVNPEQTVDQNDGYAVRGGSYFRDFRWSRVANRATFDTPNVSAEAMGMRCVKDAP